MLCLNRDPPKCDSNPTVTILKPLKCEENDRLDECLEENLASFFKLDYKNYEICFCVKGLLPFDPSIFELSLKSREAGSGIKGCGAN